MSTLVPQPGILNITPYVGGESEIAGVSRVIKLASNEGALGTSPKVREAYRAAAESLHRYPDGGSLKLRRAIGEANGIDPDRIVCGAGADELIGLLTRAYAGAGDEVLYSEHGFLMYGIAAKSASATPVTAPETNLTTDVDALLAAVTERTRVLFVANPNNPTGSYLPKSEMARLRAGLRDDVVMVVDSAYAEYVGAEDYEPGIELVDANDNVVMLRTFSKIYGLGGARLGWAYGSEQIIDVLNRVRNPFNVSAIAQEAGIAALSDPDFVAAGRRNNDEWLPWTIAQVRQIGYDVPPSVGNFILVRFPQGEGRDANAADAFLKQRGIIVRKVGAYGLGDSLRVTIGTGDEMRAFVQALGAFAGQA